MTESQQAASQAQVVHIRWMIRRDMDEVLQIQEACYADPLDEEDISAIASDRVVVLMVAETEQRVVGFMGYRLHKHFLTVLDLAVHPMFQRRGVGRAMFQKLTGKLGRPGGRKWLELAVPDTAIAAHCFLRSCGARAVEVLKGESPSGGDNYRFIYDPRTRN